jgi:hypothetical protein
MPETLSPHQEAAMASATPTRHPAAVPESYDAHPRILLAIAVSAVIGLGVAVGILAEDGPGTTATPAVGRSQSLDAPVCSRPDQRRCTPPSRGAPGAQLRLAPPSAGRRHDEGSRGPGH